MLRRIVVGGGRVRSRWREEKCQKRQDQCVAKSLHLVVFVCSWQYLPLLDVVKGRKVMVLVMVISSVETECRKATDATFIFAGSIHMILGHHRCLANHGSCRATEPTLEAMSHYRRTMRSLLPLAVRNFQQAAARRPLQWAQSRHISSVAASRTMASMSAQHSAARPQHNAKRRRKGDEKVQGKQQILEALHQQQQQQRSSLTSRRSLSPRIIAAENLIHLLKTDPSWLEDALLLLDPAHGDEYKSLFAECLTSFSHVLETNAELAHVMDRLLESGFNTFRFGKQYRRTLQYTRKYEELGEKLLKYQAEAARHMTQVETLTNELVRLKEDRDEFDKQVNEGEADTSLLYTTARFVGSLFQSDQVGNDADASSASKLDKLGVLIRQKERLVQTNRTLALTAQRHAEHVQREREHTLRNIPLSQDDIAPAATALEHDRTTICQALGQHLQTRHIQMMEQFRELDEKTDLTKPHEWYPYARLDRRKIVYHGGPTNSGKTFQALERLKEAKRGMYLGPLRLLAVEVFEKLTASGIYCSLYTGQEIQKVPFETHGAATIEMADLTIEYDIIVIDEIQMISDSQRGFAWTRALLGSRCKEIHVCGGLEAKELVERIAAACGDDFELRTYERFTSLTVAKRSLASSSDETGSYRSVQPGDCVVAFSRKDIFAIKREIETKTPHKCCVIYGSLPPLTRTEQARRFNDPDSGYDVLVASDAVGMGLNLNIRRIIFNSMYKQNGGGVIQVNHSMVKQISGRAGRRNSPFPEGEVTCRSPEDMAHLRKCMSTPVSPIQSAGLVPTAGHVEMFHQTISSYGLGGSVSNLHSILGHFSDMAKLRSDYFLCRQTPMMTVAKKLAKLNLPIRDKYTLCMSPVVESSSESFEVLKKFAAKVAVGEVPGLPQTLRPKYPASFDDLSRLCSIYSHLELFLWLQNKFPPVNVMEQQAAMSRRERTIELIGEGLTISDKLKLDHSYIGRDLKLRGGTNPAQAKPRRKRVDDTDKWMVEDV